MFRRTKLIVPAIALALVAGIVGIATADWTGTNNAGATITFCAKTTGTPNVANCMVPVEPTSGLPTTGGTMVTYLSANTTNSTSVKGSAGLLLYVLVINTGTTFGDLRLYDSASAPTCSSATGMKANIPVQSNAEGPGVPMTIPGGAYFTSGIGFCFTGANSNTDTTAAATGFNIILLYN